MGPMSRSPLLTLALLSLVLVGTVPAHGRPKGKVVDRVVAAVAGRPIVLSEVRRRAAIAEPVQSESAALEEMIDERLIAQDANRAKIFIGPQDIDEGVEAWAKERGTTKTELFPQLEAQRHMKEYEVRDEVQRRIFRSRWTERVLRPRVTPATNIDAERVKRLAELRREIEVEVLR